MTEREAIEILGRPFSMQEVPKEILDAHRLAISALEKQEQDRWIPCKERLPEYKKKVLVSYDTGKKVDISMFDRYGCLLGIVDAWRPLPAPYQEDEA